MKPRNILLIIILAILILGCSSTNNSIIEQNQSNENDALVNLMIKYFNDHSDTLVIYFPGINVIGSAVLYSNGALLNRDDKFPIENQYIQLVYTQIKKTNFMNLSDSIFIGNKIIKDEFFMNDEWNYLIVKLRDEIKHIRYRTGDLKRYPELKKLELFTRIIHSYARNYEHSRLIKELNNLHK
jgi:hypothetical protein